MFIGLIAVAVVIIGFDLLASSLGSKTRDASERNLRADGIQDETSIPPLPTRSFPPAVRQHSPRLIRRGR